MASLTNFRSNDRSVPWYDPPITAVSEDVRDLFENYSRVAPEEVVTHVINMRDAIWNVSAWPCVGAFRFIDLSLSRQPSYPQILAALKDTSMLLDIGCCVAQDFRKLVHDGARSENLVGLEVTPGLFDVAYDFFNDGDSLKSTFINADLFDRTNTTVEAMKGTFDYVHLGMILHTWTLLEDQTAACVRVLEFLKPQPGVLIVGQAVGHVLGLESGAKRIFKHNCETFARLWEVVGARTGTTWESSPLLRRNNQPVEAPLCLISRPPSPYRPLTTTIQTTSTTASLRNSTATTTLPDSQEENTGQSILAGLRRAHLQSQASDSDEKSGENNIDDDDFDEQGLNRALSPPPRYPYTTSVASASTSSSLPATRPAPPPFSSLYEYASAEDLADDYFELPPSCCERTTSKTAAPSATAAPAYAPPTSSLSDSTTSATSTAFQNAVAETKRALPQDNKVGSSAQKSDDPSEPPPAYEEGYSPLLTFTYLMAAAGGASSIITQVQQGGPPINAIGDVGADETITMDLRGTRFVLSRDELLTLPEFVLLSLFPNGLFPEGHMGGFAEGDAVQVDVSIKHHGPLARATGSTSPTRLLSSPASTSLPHSSTTRNLLSNIDIHFTDLASQYDPASLQYMLDFFRDVAQTIPNESSPGASPDGGVAPIDSLAGGRDDGSKRAGIIVLREDLDFYVIPPRADIEHKEMIEVKRAAARALLRQNGIFSGLKRSDEPGTTEAHLIEMLTAGGFNHDDRWGHRAGEPNKAVVCSLALARLRSDIRGNDMGSNAVGMAQKLLLFWRKPARRCWWEGVDLADVEGVDGPLKVWIRRVWTLEMSVIGLR
ncbi:putative Phosphatase activator [Seiridium unicorne]|uniref:Phosphatase activator n=1 Tax=Seiridium unicorne TaxID=138068 RepID=A0ABR2VBA0_9PEZI